MFRKIKIDITLDGLIKNIDNPLFNDKSEQAVKNLICAIYGYVSKDTKYNEQKKGKSTKDLKIDGDLIVSDSDFSRIGIMYRELAGINIEDKNIHWFFILGNHITSEENTGKAQLRPGTKVFEYKKPKGGIVKRK